MQNRHENAEIEINASKISFDSNELGIYPKKINKDLRRKNWGYMFNFSIDNFYLDIDLKCI